MGHKSIAMTLRYSHLSDQHLREAVQKLVTPQVTPKVVGAEKSL
jgi:site-specific recombinase XerD